MSQEQLLQRARQFLRERPHAKSIAHLRMADALVADLAEALSRLDAELAQRTTSQESP